MRGFAVALALGMLASCGGAEDAIRFRVVGRVLDAPGGNGVEGARVTCAESGRTTRTKADGRFSLSCAVVDPGEETPPVAAVRFERAGHAPVLRSLPAIEGASFAAVVALARPTVTRRIAIPTTAAPASEIIDNVVFSFLDVSLVDGAGNTAEGSADVTLAAWDPSVPARPDDTPPFLDALLPPFPTHFQTTGQDAPYLRPIAGAYLDTNPLSPNPGRGIDVTITSLYADVAFGGVAAADNRLFHQDATSGVFVESQPGRIDQRNQLTGGVNAPGTWIWAKAIPNPTCIDVHVRIGDRPYTGAQLALYDIDVQGKDQTLLDEALGTPGGTRCLRGPAGRMARLQAWMAEGDRVESLSLQTMTSAGGACGTCPRVLDVVFPCTRNSDCDPGSSCLDGACVAAEPEVPDASGE